MAAVTGAAIAGAGLVHSVVQGQKAEKAALEARASAGDQFAQSMLERQKAVEELEKVGIPPIEAQRIVLETPELVGLQEVHQLGPSELSAIEEDPRLREAQLKGLTGIEEIAETGVTEAERAEERLSGRRVGAEEMAA